MKTQVNPNVFKPDQQEAVYPAEFLDCFTETAFKTLYDYMAKSGAAPEALNLLDSAHVLIKELQFIQAGKVERAVNQVLLENVADASRCIVSLGGVFYAPSGSSMPRADQAQLQGSRHVSKDLQAVKLEKTSSTRGRARNRAATVALEGSG